MLSCKANLEYGYGVRRYAMLKNLYYVSKYFYMYRWLKLRGDRFRRLPGKLEISSRCGLGTATLTCSSQERERTPNFGNIILEAAVEGPKCLRQDELGAQAGR